MRLFSSLEGGTPEIMTCNPARVMGKTMENLNRSADGEHEEWTLHYAASVALARAERFPAVAVGFEKVFSAKNQYENRYLGLLKNG
jgi:rubrerythrin